MRLCRLFTPWSNKTTSRDAVDQSAGTTVSACHVGPVEESPLSQAALEDLRNAWAEVEAAVKESGVIKFHACSRSGQSWQDDSESVRAVAALLREH